MDWQEAVALSIVAVTVAALGWSRFRPRKFTFERETHCGCSSPSTDTGASVVFHARKGERPTITVKTR